MKEKQLGLDEKHVIVDRDAWEKAQKQALDTNMYKEKYLQLHRPQLRLNQINEIQDAFCNTSAKCVNGSCYLCLYHKSNLKEFETWFKEHLNADKKP